MTETMTETKTTDRDLCDACDEPNRLPRVTFRKMKLCRGHWRQALAGKDLTLAVAITRTNRSMAGVSEAFKRFTESAKKWVPELDESTEEAPDHE